jgi:hypothetical protein
MSLISRFETTHASLQREAADKGYTLSGYAELTLVLCSVEPYWKVAAEMCKGTWGGSLINNITVSGSDIGQVLANYQEKVRSLLV